MQQAKDRIVCDRLRQRETGASRKVRSGHALDGAVRSRLRQRLARQAVLVCRAAMRSRGSRVAAPFPRLGNQRQFQFQAVGIGAAVHERGQYLRDEIGIKEPERRNWRALALTAADRRATAGISARRAKVAQASSGIMRPSASSRPDSPASGMAGDRLVADPVDRVTDCLTVPQEARPVNALPRAWPSAHGRRGYNPSIPRRRWAWGSR